MACGGTLAKLAKVYTIAETVAQGAGMIEAGIHIGQGKAGVGDVLAFAPALGFVAQRAGLLGELTWHCPLGIDEVAPPTRAR